MLRILFLVAVVSSYRSISPRIEVNDGGHRSPEGRMKVNSGCVCGKTKTGPTSKVVGGKETLPFEFPWLVYIKIKHPGRPDGSCGGTLINDRFVLTAGLCVTDSIPNSNARKPRSANRLTAIFHTFTPLKEDSTVNIPMEIEDMFINQDFLNGLSAESDIAILLLKRRVDITDPKFNPICLPQRSDVINFFHGRDAVVAGWGALSRDAPNEQSPTSQKLKVPLHSTEYCKQYIPDRDFSRVFCADDSGETGASKGDGGGPLFMDLPSGHKMQIGIVSAGVTVKPPHEPGAVRRFTYYAKLTRLLPLIDITSQQFGANWCKRTSTPR